MASPLIVGHWLLGRQPDQRPARLRLCPRLGDGHVVKRGEVFVDDSEIGAQERLEPGITRPQNPVDERLSLIAHGARHLVVEVGEGFAVLAGVEHLINEVRLHQHRADAVRGLRGEKALDLRRWL